MHTGSWSSRTSFRLSLLAVASLAACDVGISGNGPGGYGDLGANQGDGGAIVQRGLPCVVANMLQSRCARCHGTPPSGGAANTLETRDDLIGTSAVYPGVDEAHRALIRMQAGTMPPGGGVPQAEITALSDWIKGGELPVTCENIVDAGAPVGDLAYKPSDSGPPGTGLPCDLAQLLESKCASCHGTPLRNNAPNRLSTRDDLIAASQADPNMNYAQRSLLRMMQNQMPPGGTNGPADLAPFQNWINAGYPVGNCGPGTDGGVIPDPLNAAPTCTSKKTQAQTNNGSANMDPGEACITCHAKDPGAPKFAVAGTLYPTGHEPDLCAGVNGVNLANALVVITDANKVVYNLRASSSGNFALQSRTFKAPYTAKVTYMGRERPMAAPQTNGDCNMCHTQMGAQNAPGRVVLPAP